MGFDTIETAFMMTLDGEQKDIDNIMIGRTIHAAMICPQPNGLDEWGISITPLGKVISYESIEGVVKITIDLLHGEVDRV